MNIPFLSAYRQRLLNTGLAVVVMGLAACSTTPLPPAPEAQAASVPAETASPSKAAEATASTETASNNTASTDNAPAEASAIGPAVDPLRPDVVVNLDDQSAHKDLWQRVRRGFSVSNLESDLVRGQEQWYASRPDYVQRMTTRGSRYLFHIVEEIERRNMPTELALLPFIESAFNPQAMSSAKASGMWQFMPATGKFFDLKQNLFRDDRRDVLASTRAALDYLQKLYGMFGDWKLALAAYNWGEGNVQRAIARNQKAGLPTDYQSLNMPIETQNYVPKLQAVKNIVTQPEAFGLSLPALENHPYFLAIPIERDMDVELAAKFSGMNVEEFRSLNPQMNKPVILAAGTPQLLLPYDNASDFVRQLKSYKGPLASWTAWVAPKTMRPSEVAKNVGMEESQLREINRIPPHMVVKAGSTLLVTRSAHKTEDVPEHVADTASISLAAEAPEKRKLAVKVGPKDSLTGIAKRYRVSTAQVAQWNQLSTNAKLRAGQSVVVYVAQNYAAQKASAASTPTSSTRTARATTETRSARVSVNSHTGKHKVVASGRKAAKVASGRRARTS